MAELHRALAEDRSPEIVPADSGRVGELSIANLKVTLGCLLGQMFGSSLLPFGALPLLMLPMTQAFGWSEAAFSGAVSFFMICGAGSGPFLGRSIDRAGTRRMIMAGTLMVGLVTLALSLVQGAIWLLYLAYALIGIAGSTALGYARIISGLFERNRGKALAIFGAEAALAGAIVPLIVEAVLSHAGWRAVYLVLGGMILATLPIQYLLLVEPRATDRSVLPDGGGASGLTGREARASLTYWWLIVATLLAAVPRLGFMVFIVPILTERGFDRASAAWAIACITVAAPLGCLLAGIAMDRFRTPRAIVPFFAAALLATVPFAVLSADFGGRPALALASLLFGLTLHVHIPMMSCFHARYFGLRAFTEIYGLSVAILAIGIGISTPLLGFVRALEGATALLVAISCGCLMIAIVMFWLARPFPRPHIGPELDEAGDDQWHA